MDLQTKTIYPFLATLFFLHGGAEIYPKAIGVTVIGPEIHIALGGPPLTFNLTLNSDNQTDLEQIINSPTIISIQLTFLQEEDGTESLVGTRPLNLVPALNWTQVSFDCGLIVRGGIYYVRLLHTGPPDLYVYLRSYNHELLESQNTIRLKVIYPTITFDVPNRLEAYTPNVLITFGLTRSLCPALKPLPATVLLLTRNPDESEGHRGHYSTVLMEDPLIRLEREGREAVTVKCQLWSRNSSYRIEIREKWQKRRLIAKSWTIKVDWSFKFGLVVTKSSIVPCRRNVRVTLSYPQCIHHGRDKVRIYGYQSLPVPSLLAPHRQSYITEKLVQSNGTDEQETMVFPCSFFPQRFSKYCFQYVNTAEDESVAVVMEQCVPTFSPKKFIDGGWSGWSNWSECSATCGQDGKRFRYRFCDSPQPSYGGSYCRGSSIEEKGCEGEDEDQDELTLPHCPTEMTMTSTTVTTTPTGMDSPEVEYPMKPSHWFVDEPTPHFDQAKTKGSTTTGCECGCILQDLIPGFNYTLVISLNSNHSSCEDLDEQDHHNLRWILHTRGSRDRIRFQILAAAARCVVLTFRDGNTSDSNLLKLITAPVLSRRNESVTVIESTGTSLSIGAADDMSSNCTLPSMYFFGYYQIFPPPPPDLGDQFLTWKDFWTFLLLKLSVLIFLIVSVVSLLSGCAKKVYDYKELKGTRGGGDMDDEDGTGMMTTSTTALEYRNSSRATSITLLPFDACYLRRLRLKHFLLRPRKVTATHAHSPHVKSLPNTPNSLRRRNLKPDQNQLLKTISLSDTNLDRPHDPVPTPKSRPVVTTTTMTLVTDPTPSTSTDLTPRVGSRSYIGSENDLELDYYDYDIQNAGNIPGSYLLEQPYLFWTESDYSNCDDHDQGIELMNTSMGTSMGGTTSSSMGLFTPEPPVVRDQFIKETSFDTLDGYQIKFVDDEEEEDDEETRTIGEG